MHQIIINSSNKYKSMIIELEICTGLSTKYMNMIDMLKNLRSKCIYV